MKNLYEKMKASLQFIRQQKTVKVSDVEKELEKMVGDDPKILHVHAHQMLSSTLKETSVSLYDFYLDKEGKIDRLVDAAKGAVAEFSPVFAEAEKSYPSVMAAVENDENMNTFMEAHRWLRVANIKEITAVGTLNSTKDTPFAAYEYFFLFHNRNDVVEFAKNNPTNFIAFAFQDRKSEGISERHLYFIAKYIDRIYIIRTGSEADRYGLMNIGSNREPNNPFTHYGDPLTAAALFRQNEIATSNLPVLKGLSKEILNVVSYDNLSKAQKLFISFCQERLAEELKDVYAKNSAEVVVNMQTTNLLPLYGKVQKNETELICESPLSEYLYKKFEPLLKSFPLLAHDFFATEKEFALMAQYEKEKAICALIKEKIREEVGTRRGGEGKALDKYYVAHAAAEEKNLNVLMEKLTSEDADLKKIILNSDRAVIFKKKGKEFHMAFGAQLNPMYDHNNHSVATIGVYDQMVVKKGFGVHNSYDDNERRAEWRHIGLEDAQAVVTIAVFSVFTLIKMLGQETVDSLPFIYNAMSGEYADKSKYGIKKSHFNLNSPIDMLVNKITGQNTGLSISFPLSMQMADELISAVEETHEDVHKEYNRDFVQHGVPGYLYHKGELFRPQWDMTAVGKIPGCALFIKGEKR